MGAEYFCVTGEGTLSEGTRVFQELSEDAAWEYGHGGYTGTIAEKGGFFDISRYIAPGTPYNVVESYFLDFTCGGGERPSMPSWWIGSQVMLSSAWLRWNDKWEDALAYHLDGRWYFFGFASS